MSHSIRPIETDAELLVALARFEELMFSKPGTLEYVEMSALGVQIREYERDVFESDQGIDLRFPNI